MPIYGYKCSNGHTFEVMKRMSDTPVDKCEVCDAPVERVYHPVAIHFKGSGFHNTDYKKSKNGARSSDRDAESGKDSGKKTSETGSEKPKDKDSAKSSDTSGDKKAAKK